MRKEKEIVLMRGKEDNSLQINIEEVNLPVGTVLIASSLEGICMITLAQPFQSEEEALKLVRKRFPKASLQKNSTPHSTEFLKCWNQQPDCMTFHLKGTAFQTAVWKELLNIPYGETRTYGEIAKAIGHPAAYRAVGTAVGDNPVFYAIPCHRVLPASGKTGNYFWGSALKDFLLKKERSE